MTAAFNVYQAVRSWHDMFSGASGLSINQWLASHPDEWKIVQEWIKLSEEAERDA